LDNALVDSAGASAGAVSNFDVTAITPRSSPGVLDQDILDATFDSPADTSHSVVEVSAASSGVEDAAGVVLE